MPHSPHPRPTPTRRAGAGIAAALTALAPLALSVPAHAETPAATRSQEPVVVVMDYSGSMLNGDADAQGTTRVDAAKAAAKDLVDATPDGAQLGLVAYGHRREKDCKDIETVHQLGPVDKSALKGRIDALGAHGETPISGALTQAAEELKGQDGRGSIVLVSDGEPSCNTPPACEVAEGLKKQGLDVTIHTVGFRISGNSRAQETLECIAEATGGTYTEAEDAQQLTEQLTTQTTRALQGYTATGTPVRGGDAWATAAPLTAGQYVDELVPRDERADDLQAASFTDGSVRFYRVPLHEGYSPVLSATLVRDRESGSRDGSSTLQIQSVDRPDARYSCTTQDARESGTAPTAVWGNRQNLEHAHNAIGERDGCLTDQDELVVAVQLETENASADSYPVEFQLSYEKTGKPQGAPPAGKPQKPDVTPTEPTPTAGGGSFNDATAIEPGETVADTVLPGERRYFTVPAQTGQQIAPRLDFPTEPQESNIEAGVTGYNPFREQLKFTGDVDGSSNDINTIWAKKGEHVQGVLSTPIHPNRRINAGLTSRHEGAASVPGRQYVVVYHEYDPTFADTPMDFELTVDVLGEGEPESELTAITTAAQYDEAFGTDQAEGSPDAEAGESASSTPEADAGRSDEPVAPETATQDAAASSPAQPAAEDATAAAAESETADDGVPAWGWVLGGVGLLAVAVGAGLVAATRRSGGA